MKTTQEKTQAVRAKIEETVGPKGEITIIDVLLATAQNLKAYLSIDQDGNLYTKEDGRWSFIELEQHIVSWVIYRDLEWHARYAPRTIEALHSLLCPGEGE